MNTDVLQFDRPDSLQANAPAEDRGLDRDRVRLLVTTPDGSTHGRFTDLPRMLVPGDLLVVNESATIPASLPAEGRIGPFVVNLSTNYGGGLWLVEPRWSVGEPGPLPLKQGDEVRMAGLAVRLVSEYPRLERLWFAHIVGDVAAALTEHGSPIRYGYLDQGYPLEAYQTIFARVPGSAEMPSAARPFTQDVLDGLEQRGVELAGIVLHTGVSSLEIEAGRLQDQVLYPEPFKVSPAAAWAVNEAKDEGRRVIAVGTTVVKALESAWDGQQVRPASGFTRSYIHPGRRPHAVAGLLTGFHDPMASHLAMLYALAGEETVRSAYAEAVAEGYLWHEFGDSNLILL